MPRIDAVFLTTPRLMLSAAAAMIIIVGFLLVTRPGPEAMADQLFTRIAEHIAVGNTGDIMDEIDADYDIRSQWPRQAWLDEIYHQAQQRTADHPGADPEQVFRQSIRVTLGRFGLAAQQQGDPQLAYTVHSVGAVANGRFDAILSFDLSGFYRPLTVSDHRFTLSIDGWLRPAARIYAHDPLYLN